MTLDGDTCRDSVTGVHAWPWRRGYLLIWRRCYGHAASAADQCASLLDEALELPSRYLSFAVLFILLWKKESKSGHVLQGKRRRLDIEDIVPTLSADAADDNVEDRSLSVFCFSVRYCIFADQHLKYQKTCNVCASFCMHYVFANTCNYIM